MKKWASVLMVLMLLCVSIAWGEEKKTMFDEEWYRQALQDSVMSVGNNARLKKVIERAQSGEVITLATIGGSITEGAGASSYKECWASRFHIRFRTEYGAANGSNVCFVNAGVGGTPSPFRSQGCSGSLRPCMSASRHFPLPGLPPQCCC